MNGSISNWLDGELREMRAALPFTKFTIATSLGAETGMLLMLMFSIDARVAIAVAIVVAAGAGWVMRKP